MWQRSRRSARAGRRSSSPRQRARRRTPSCRSRAATRPGPHRGSGVQGLPRRRLRRSGAQQHLARDAPDTVGASAGRRADPGGAPHVVGSPDRRLLWLVGEDDQASPRRVRLVGGLSIGRRENGARRSGPTGRCRRRAGEHRRRAGTVSRRVAADDRRFGRRIAGDGPQRAEPVARRPGEYERSARGGVER